MDQLIKICSRAHVLHKWCAVLYCYSIASSRAVCQQGKKSNKQTNSERGQLLSFLPSPHSPNALMLFVQLVCGEDALRNRLKSVEKENILLKQQREVHLPL